jgi:glycosyltransferase involved in cell wall biosynthesis
VSVANDKPTPSLTVIIPVRNGITYLRETIECVHAQQYPAFEIVVVDDGSTDGSGALAASLPACRVLTTEGIGPAGARNLALRHSDSELILFLDADDLLGQDAIAASVAALQSHPEAGFAQGFVQNFLVRADGSMNIFTRPYRYINIGSGVWRRSVFDRIGLFDESLRYCEDLDFLMRCWEHDIPKVLIDRVVLLYRRHPANMTRGLEGVGFGTMRAFRKRIERVERGMYDPHAPHHVSWPEYFGSGPAVMDLE